MLFFIEFKTFWLLTGCLFIIEYAQARERRLIQSFQHGKNEHFFLFLLLQANHYKNLQIFNLTFGHLYYKLL